MSANCQNCGAVLEDGEKFCHACGKLAEFTANSQPQQSAPTPNFSQPQYQQPQYQQPYAPVPPYGAQQVAPVMKVGDYMITMLIAAIPCVGIIFLFIWAFGSEANPNKKNYCRAVLIWSAIILALYIVVAIVFAIIGASFFNSVKGSYYNYN